MTVIPAPEAIHATALAAELTGRLRGHGPLPFAGYMTRCLYDPHLGYYTRGFNFASEHGTDFATAPTMSPLFGATLANWVARRWHSLGQPHPFTLLEAGPGSGHLMQALLAQLSAASPDCHAAASVHLLETSPALTLRQQQRLTGHAITWHTSLDTIPDTHPIILLANEVLDAFPVDVFTHTSDGWLRRHVVLNDAGALTLTDRPTRHAPQLPPGWQPDQSAVFEVSTSLHQWLTRLRVIMQHIGGVTLFIDYGHAELPPSGGETVQALYRHQPVALLHRPGESDLTAHVHFGWAAAQLGGTHTLADLSPFLMQHGLLTLAEPTILQPETQGVLQRLLHPARMGKLFKVLESRFAIPV